MEPDLVPSCQCHVWSLKQDKEVCLDLHLITRITAAPPIKVLDQLLGHYFILGNSKLFFFSYVGSIVNFVIRRKSTKDLIQESLVAENSYALMFPQ